MQISTALRTTLADAIDAAVGATGEVRFYTAARASLLATAPCNNPAFGAASAGAITLDVDPAVEDTSPGNAGTCVLMGLYAASGDAATAFVVEMGVATSGSPDITMSNNVIAVTDTVQVSSLVITVPAGTPTT